MKKTMYNKLVRDKVPNVIIGQNLSFKAHKCSDNEFIEALASKIVEEANEVKQAWEASNVSKSEAKQNDLLSEMADLLEVFIAFAKANGVPASSLEKACSLKRAQKGGFSDRIFLEWVEAAT